MLARHAGHELSIRVRVSPTELVIEVNDRKDNSEPRAEFQEKPQQANRIAAPGNGHTDAVSRLQQMLLPDVLQKPAGEIVHENIVQPGVGPDTLLWAAERRSGSF